jgi:hypothetical protein
MTDTVTSQNIDVSSWGTLFVESSFRISEFLDLSIVWCFWEHEVLSWRTEKEFIQLDTLWRRNVESGAQWREQLLLVDTTKQISSKFYT